MTQRRFVSCSVVLGLARPVAIALGLSVAALAAVAPLCAAETPAPAAGLERATFAGGCFWCMQPPFEKLDGVVSVAAGYTGGTKVDPTYEEVSSGTTGHAESVEVVFDPKKVSYEKLLDVFWHNIDPTQAEGQFCDHGHQYRSAIFFHDPAQKAAAEASLRALAASGTLHDPIVTEIVPAGPFYRAEEYHQDFWKKNPFRYRLYRAGCGRDGRLRELWGVSEH